MSMNFAPPPTLSLAVTSHSVTRLARQLQNAFSYVKPYKTFLLIFLLSVLIFFSITIDLFHCHLVYGTYIIFLQYFLAPGILYCAGCRNTGADQTE